MAKRQPAAAPPRPKRQPPEKKFAVGGIGVAIWLNTIDSDDGSTKSFRSLTIAPRRYQDRQTGAWRDSATVWIVNPQPMEFTIQGDTEWFRPDDDTLAELVQRFTNRAIGRACGVSDMTVRNWLKAAAIERSTPPTSRCEVPADEVRDLRRTSERRKTFTSPCKGERMTVERVGRVISLIGQKANIVVRDGGSRASGNSKYASAHDLRRGFAHRMINLGVTAETLTLLLRHADFATTRKFYGATRSAQAAGQEVRELLERKNPSLVGGLVGGPEPIPAFNLEEVAKLKAILATL